MKKSKKSLLKKYRNSFIAITLLIIVLLISRETGMSIAFEAGPLYTAFPIAAILMKKSARFAYIIFFLGVWSSTKLPIAIYEVTSFGLPLIYAGVTEMVKA